jgi:hypothetical protein
MVADSLSRRSANPSALEQLFSNAKTGSASRSFSATFSPTSRGKCVSSKDIATPSAERTRRSLTTNVPGGNARWRATVSSAATNRLSHGRAADFELLDQALFWRQLGFWGQAAVSDIAGQNRLDALIEGAIMTSRQRDIIMSWRPGSPP